jgi:hypothetical protein
MRTNEKKTFDLCLSAHLSVVEIRSFDPSLRSKITHSKHTHHCFVCTDDDVGHPAFHPVVVLSYEINHQINEVI